MSDDFMNDKDLDVELLVGIDIHNTESRIIENIETVIKNVNAKLKNVVGIDLSPLLKNLSTQVNDANSQLSKAIDGMANKFYSDIEKNIKRNDNMINKLKEQSKQVEQAIQGWKESITKNKNLTINEHEANPEKQFWDYLSQAKIKIPSDKNSQFYKTYSEELNNQAKRLFGKNGSQSLDEMAQVGKMSFGLEMDKSEDVLNFLKRGKPSVEAELKEYKKLADEQIEEAKQIKAKLDKKIAELLNNNTQLRENKVKGRPDGGDILLRVGIKANEQDIKRMNEEIAIIESKLRKIILGVDINNETLDLLAKIAQGGDKLAKAQTELVRQQTEKLKQDKLELEIQQKKIDLIEKENRLNANKEKAKNAYIDDLVKNGSIEPIKNQINDINSKISELTQKSIKTDGIEKYQNEIKSLESTIERLITKKTELNEKLSKTPEFNKISPKRVQNDGLIGDFLFEYEDSQIFEKLAGKDKHSKLFNDLDKSSRDLSRRKSEDISSKDIDDLIKKYEKLINFVNKNKLGESLNDLPSHIDIQKAIKNSSIENFDYKFIKSEIETVNKEIEDTTKKLKQQHLEMASIGKETDINLQDELATLQKEKQSLEEILKLYKEKKAVIDASLKAKEQKEQEKKNAEEENKKAMEQQALEWQKLQEANKKAIQQAFNEQFKTIAESQTKLKEVYSGNGQLMSYELHHKNVDGDPHKTRVERFSPVYNEEGKFSDHFERTSYIDTTFNEKARQEQAKLKQMQDSLLKIAQEQVKQSPTRLSYDKQNQLQSMVGSLSNFEINKEGLEKFKSELEIINGLLQHALELENLQDKAIQKTNKEIEKAKKSQESLDAYRVSKYNQITQLGKNDHLSDYVPKDKITNIKGMFDELSTSSSKIDFSVAEVSLKNLIAEVARAEAILNKKTKYDQILKDMEKEGIYASEDLTNLKKKMDELSHNSPSLKGDVQAIDAEIKRLKIEAKNIDAILNDLIKSEAKMNSTKSPLKNDDNIKKISDQYKEQIDLINQIRKAGQELTEEQVKQVQERVKAIDKEIDRLKADELENNRLNKIGHTIIGTVTNNSAYLNEANAKKEIANQWNQHFQSQGKNTTVGIDDIQVTRKIDPATQKALYEYIVTLKEGKNVTVQYKGALDEATTSVRQLGDAHRVTANRNLGFMSAMETAMKKIPIWMVSMTMFYQSLNFFKDGVKYANDLNQALTQISIVTGQNQMQVTELGKSYHDLAVSMSVTTKEIADTAVEYYRQGLGESAVNSRLQDTIKYSKISNLALKESAQIITASVNSMGVSSQKAIDTFAYMGDATATGADEIGKAMQKVGGTAKATNVEFDKVASWIATISGKTRESASTIGDSIKSILARVQSLKATGYDSADGTDVNQVSKALKSINVNLIDQQTGQFRNFGTVMDEIGKKWQNLDTRQRAFIATTVAGTYQQSKFLNLMESYSTSVDLYNKSLESAGIATNKYNLWLEGTEAKLNKLKETWERTWEELFKSSEIQGMISSLTSLANAFQFLVTHIGVVPVTVSAMYIAFTIFNKGFQEFSTKMTGAFMDGFKNASIAINKTTTSLEGASIKTKAYNVLTTTATGVTKAFTGATRALAVALETVGNGIKFVGRMAIPIIALTALSFILEKLTGWYYKKKEAEEEAQKVEDRTIENYTNQRSKIDELIKAHKDLDEATNGGRNFKDEEQENKYYEINKQLSDLMPKLTESIDAQGRVRLKNIDAIEKETKATEKLIEAKNNEKLSNAPKDIDELYKDYKEQKDKANGFREKINQVNIDKDYANENTSNPVKLKRLNEEYNRQINELTVEALRADQEAEEKADKYKKELTDILNMQMKSKQLILSAEASDALSQSMLKLPTSDDTKGQLADILKLGEAITKMKELQNKNNGVLDADSVKEVFDLAEKMGVLNDKFKETIRNIAGVKLAKDQKPFDIGKQIEEASKQIEGFINKNKDLGDALSAIDNGNELSAKQIADLVKNHEELAGKVEVYNGKLTIERSAIEELMKAKETEFKKGLEQAKQTLELQKQDLIKKLEMNEMEVQSIINITDAKEREQAIFRQAVKEHGGDSKYYDARDYEVINQKAEARKADFNQLKQNMDLIKQYEAMLKADFTTDLTGSKPNHQDLLDARQDIKEMKNALKDYDIEMKKSENALEGQIKGTKEYSDELKKQLKLMELKKQLLELEISALKEMSKANKDVANSATDAIKAQTGVLTSQSTDGVQTGRGYGIDYRKLDSQLGGNLSGYGQTIVEASNKYGVDPALATAIIALETGHGSNVNGNNVGGLMNPETNWQTKQVFDTLADGIYAFVANLAKNYDMSDITKMGAKYAPIGASNDPNGTNKDWVPSVSKIYAQITGQQYANPNNANKVTDDRKKKDEIDKQIAEKQLQVEELNTKLQNMKFQIVLSGGEEFERQIKKIDLDMAYNEETMKRLEKTSSGYSDSIQQQTQYLKDKQEQLDKESEYYQDVIDVMEKYKDLSSYSEDEQEAIKQRIKDLGVDHLTNAQLDEIKIKLKEIRNSKEQLQDSINELDFQQLQNKIQPILDKIEYLNSELELSQARNENNETGSKEWTSEKHTEISIYKQLQVAKKEQIELDKQQLKSMNLTAEERRTILANLRKDELDFLRLGGNINKANDELVNNAIEAYKNAYTKMKEAEMNQLEQESQQMEELHQKKMNNLDDELKAYNKIADAQIKAIDRSEESQDYQDEYSKVRRDQLDLQRKYDALSLDNSLEGQLKRADIKRQLDDKTEELEKLVRHRKATTQKEAIEDDKQRMQEQFDDRKKDLEEDYKAEKDNLERRKKDRSEYYDSIINDEERFKKWRQQALNGEVKDMTSAFEKLKTEIDSRAKYINETLRTNVINTLNQIDLSSLGVSGRSPSDPSDYSGGAGQDNGDEHTATHGRFYGERPIINNIVYNKGIAEEARRTLEENPDDEEASGKLIWAESQNNALYQQLSSEAKALLWNMTYDEAVNFMKTEAYHEGGIVGGSGSNGADLINKIFNSKDNERYVKALIGEVYIPPQNISNGINAIKSVLGSFGTLFSPTAKSSNPVFNIKIDVGSVTGGKEGADTLINEFVKGIKKLGGGNIF